VIGTQKNDAIERKTGSQFERIRTDLARINIAGMGNHQRHRRLQLGRHCLLHQVIDHGRKPAGVIRIEFPRHNGRTDIGAAGGLDPQNHHWNHEPSKPFHGVPPPVFRSTRRQ